MQQLRQETGIRVCEKVFDPNTDKPSKVTLYTTSRSVNYKMAFQFQLVNCVALSRATNYITLSKATSCRRGDGLWQSKTPTCNCEKLDQTCKAHLKSTTLPTKFHYCWIQHREKCLNLGGGHHLHVDNYPKSQSMTSSLYTVCTH